jgi:predicted TIM-barrel fold metal-dependent hydrolase
MRLCSFRVPPLRQIPGISNGYWLNPYIAALIDAFTHDNCVWGSDWPFVCFPARTDYGPQLPLLARWVPDEAQRRRVLWEAPRRWFGFQAQA